MKIVLLRTTCHLKSEHASAKVSGLRVLDCIQRPVFFLVLL